MPPSRRKIGFDIEEALTVVFIIFVFVVAFGILFIPKDIIYKLSTLPLYANLGF